jgi:uncharacterized membrane protein
MKKLCVLMFMLVAFSFVMASQQTLLDVHQNEVKLLNSSDSGLEINFELGSIQVETVETKSGNFAQVSAADYILTGEVGMPQVPFAKKIIEVPLGATVEAFLNIKSESTINLGNRGFNYKVKPAQPSVEKCIDKSEVAFEIDEKVYNTNQMITRKNVTVKEIGIMRGTRLFEVNFYPVSYNPVTGDMNIINSAEVTVDFLGADYAATEELKAKTNSFMFNSAMSKTVFNHNSTRNSLETYPLGYVIVTPEMFVDTLEPFINWKKEQGYNVTLGITETIGSSTAAIKNYMQGLWDAATPSNPAPSYLLIVGDTPQVPAFTGSTDSGHVTDLNYVRLEGNDYLPEMYYGRFSATSVAQLTPQVNKTLMYEKYEFSDPSYLGRTTLIAGVDANWAPTHGNGTLHYGAENYFNDDNFDQVNEYPYPASGSSESAINTTISNGVGYLNYTAHGTETTWHDPHMSISDVNGFQNSEMYPVVVGNCCLTNHFNTGTCFGEAWLRAQNGAVIYVGGTNSTYWDEDYWWSVGHFTPTSINNPTYAGTGYGGFDALFHNHDEDFEDWAHTIGSWIHVGNMTVQGSASSRKNYYWEIYSIMGDPSLMPYMGIPEAQTASYQETILLGMDSFAITAAPYSYAALSMDGELIGAALLDGSGNGSIPLTGIENPGNVKLVITHTDYQPVIETLEVIPAAGAYLVIDSHTVTGDLAAGQDATLNFDIRNVGVEALADVAITVTGQANATVGTSDGTIANIAADEVVTVSTDFLFTLDNGLTDGEEVVLAINIVAGDQTWDYSINLNAIAPEIDFDSYAIDDNDNNLLDPGETADVEVSFTNNGSYVANDLVAVLSTTTPGVTIINSQVDFDAVAINATQTATFTVETSDFMDAGTTAAFTVNFESANEVESNGSFTAPVGLIFEDFETGDFSSNFNYGTTSWTVVSDDAHGGTYSVRSNDINDNQSTSMSIQMDDVAAGEISFWLKVSSEATYDELSFAIDGQAQDSWSGTVAWQEATYEVTAGNHTFTWTYEKDYSMSSGSDCAWVDDIVFPSVAGNAGSPEIAVDLTSHDFGTVTVATVDMEISNNGEGILAGQVVGTEIFKVSINDEEEEESLNYSLDPNQTLTVTIHFLPTANISYSDVVTITSNDENNSEIQVTVNGVGDGVSNDNNIDIPLVTELQGNYPNPFNPETTVRYAVKENGQISLKIFNIKGQLVKTLVNQEVKAGYHQILWNGQDNFGTDVASGIYMYRLETKTYNQTKKMMLMK